MCYVDYEKRKKTNNGPKELPNQERNLKIGEKETCKYLGMLEADTVKQVEMKEKKNEYLRRTIETSRNQALQQEPHQKDKHLGCHPC